MGGFMAAVEVIHFISIFPIFLRWNTRAGKREGGSLLHMYHFCLFSSELLTIALLAQLVLCILSYKPLSTPYTCTMCIGKTVKKCFIYKAERYQTNEAEERALWNIFFHVSMGNIQSSELQSLTFAPFSPQRRGWGWWRGGGGRTSWLCLCCWWWVEGAT